jgi:hypothetical protein
MNLRATLDSYLGKKVRFSEQDNGDGTKEVCDLDTGELKELDINTLQIGKSKLKLFMG